MHEQTVKRLPLEGRRILNTRTYEQAGTFSSQLRTLGAIPVEFPIDTYSCSRGLGASG